MTIKQWKAIHARLARIYETIEANGDEDDSMILTRIQRIMRSVDHRIWLLELKRRTKKALEKGE